MKRLRYDRLSLIKISDKETTQVPKGEIWKAQTSRNSDIGYYPTGYTLISGASETNTIRDIAFKEVL